MKKLRFKKPGGSVVGAATRHKPHEPDDLLHEEHSVQPLVDGEVLGEVRVEQRADYGNVAVAVTVTLPVVLDLNGPYRVDAPFDDLPLVEGIAEAERIGRKEMNRIAKNLRRKQP